MERPVITEGHDPPDLTTDNANKPVLNSDDPDKIESEAQNEQDILHSADT